MNFKLENNEITFILQVLGELPTKTGAFQLLQNLEAQYKAQGAAKSTEVDIVEEV